jgi:signal peptidase I
MGKNPESFELIPEVKLVDFNYDENLFSNVLLSYSDGESIQTFHYVNGRSQVIDPQHLMETLKVEESQGATSGAKKPWGRFLVPIGYFLAILLFAFSVLSFTSFIKARVVLTGSMAPAISTGSVIITTPVKYKSPKIGDVIAYQAKRFNGSPVAVFSHRIIGGNIYTGFIVKGDNNKLPDSQRPKLEDILGVVILVIPYIGNLLTPKALFLLAPTIFGFYLIIGAMKNVE